MTDMTSGELQEAIGYIQAARHALEEGNGIDLKPLEIKIEHFCRSLGELPPEQREAMRKKVIALLDDLDHLADDLRSQYAELGERLGKMNTHHRALSAYGNPSNNKK